MKRSSLIATAIFAVLLAGTIAAWLGCTYHPVTSKVENSGAYHATRYKDMRWVESGQYFEEYLVNTDTGQITWYGKTTLPGGVMTIKSIQEDTFPFLLMPRVFKPEEVLRLHDPEALELQRKLVEVMAYSQQQTFFNRRSKF